jgi:periplasmic divalent cation tolerance protein
MNALRVVLCTFPDIASARQIGTSLVEKQLAACVNLIPAVESIYHWQGAVETSAEVLGIFKTRADACDEFTAALAGLHPYEIPEIVVIEPDAVAESYIAWLFASVKPAQFPRQSEPTASI